MMKRLLIAFLTVLTVAGFALASPAPPAKNAKTPNKGVRLTEQQIQTIQAVQPWIGNKAKKNLSGLSPRYEKINDRKAFLTLSLFNSRKMCALNIRVLAQGMEGLG